jgi:hypothetical protein
MNLFTSVCVLALINASVVSSADPRRPGDIRNWFPVVNSAASSPDPVVDLTGNSAASSPDPVVDLTGNSAASSPDPVVDLTSNSAASLPDDELACEPARKRANLDFHEELQDAGPLEVDGGEPFKHYVDFTWPGYRLATDSIKNWVLTQDTWREIVDNALADAGGLCDAGAEAGAMPGRLRQTKDGGDVFWVMGVDGDE